MSHVRFNISIKIKIRDMQLLSDLILSESYQFKFGRLDQNSTSEVLWLLIFLSIREPRRTCYRMLEESSDGRGYHHSSIDSHACAVIVSFPPRADLHGFDVFRRLPR